MASSEVFEFNDDNFETEVLQSEIPTLVDFWAPWCGPCRMIAPTIDQLASEANGEFRIGKLNVDNSPTTPSRYGISGIPTLMIFKNGEVVQRFTGVTGKDELARALKSAL